MRSVYGLQNVQDWLCRKAGDATGLSRGIFTFVATLTSLAITIGCHGLAPWRFTIAANSSKHETPRGKPVVSLCLLVVLLAVIALVVIVIVRLKIDVVQHHAEDLRADVVQQLLRTAHDVTRTLATMDHEQYAVHHR